MSLNRCQIVALKSLDRKSCPPKNVMFRSRSVSVKINTLNDQTLAAPSFLHLSLHACFRYNVVNHPNPPPPHPN